MHGLMLFRGGGGEARCGRVSRERGWQRRRATWQAEKRGLPRRKRSSLVRRTGAARAQRGSRGWRQGSRGGLRTLCHGKSVLPRKNVVLAGENVFGGAKKQVRAGKKT